MQKTKLKNQENDNKIEKERRKPKMTSFLKKVKNLLDSRFQMTKFKNKQNSKRLKISNDKDNRIEKKEKKRT
jgi:hypothetical protein